MQDDVERVARALCAASGDVWRSSKGVTAAAKSAGIDPAMVNNHWLYKARAAMVATLELTAEALRGIVSGQDETEGAAQTNIADWLQQRANEVKEAGNG